MDEAGYQELFATFALDETVVAGDPGETIRLPGTAAHQSLGSLPLLRLAVGDEVSGAELRVGRTLGEGGMGIIREATQHPFERGVALKTVRGEVSSQDAAFSLVREAIAAGRLEHPNIVPIYAVGKDDAGQPVIVMKHIQGGSWREVLADASLVPADDTLQWHLQVFMQVCAAVHFSHSCGVLHRDIKPDNVMVGAHEDVYLVDWGLAVTVEVDPSGRLPCVADLSGVAGTPAYMAPEMAGGGALPLDERTDVYLLGAVLHEVVTGTPRHQGDTVLSIMFSAYRSEPIDYDAHVPAELAAICNRATAASHDDRFQTAIDLRDAVKAFLEHRSSAALTLEALAQLAALAEVIGDAAADERHVKVYRRYGAARFGFERSLAEWADQPSARTGLQRTLELMIEWELGHGSAHAAAALVEDLPEPRPDLRRKVKEVDEHQQQEQQELASLREHRHETDIGVGAGGRAIQLLLLAMFGIIIPGAVAMIGPWDPRDSPFGFWLIAFVLGVVVIVTATILWRLELVNVERTRTNRQLGSALIVICTWLVLARGFAMLSGISIAAELTLELVGFAGFTAMIATAFDRRILVGSLCYLLGAVATHLWVPLALEIFLLANAVALLVIARVWWRTQRALP